jgi:hypothetical protein
MENRTLDFYFQKKIKDENKIDNTFYLEPKRNMIRLQKE